MKRLLIAAVSAMVLTVGLSMEAQASEMSLKEANEVTPDEIFNLARNGYFEDEGIPSHGGLISAYKLGNVTAEDLVSAAIEQNRLSPETLQNRRFVRAVNQYLRSSSNGN
ncbi:hypothetical protein H6G89_21500 [Oscillatoria sp. FACHB-1407]|uniref:hypothetical protein n=1 Tax=Oscillatoria sp. FACHB-1407 TaxID=2692847 RepID=UPI0016878DDB|nr:hypothetical protein [Oscillatoria sp. FACHB-1407]MBD2463581.1 hypothetical protein [Oscillatoria sp. FACHB-1407]